MKPLSIRWALTYGQKLRKISTVLRKSSFKCRTGIDPWQLRVQDRSPKKTLVRTGQSTLTWSTKFFKFPRDLRS